MQRITWSHALYFVRQVAKDYKILLDAQRAAMLSLLRHNSSFTKLRNQLSSDISSLLSKIDFFHKCHDFDCTKYQDQASYGISSDKMYANWTEMEVQVRKFSRLKQDVKSMESQAASINLKVMELNRSPFAKNQHDKILQEAADEALQLCTDLRNRSYEKRSKKSENVPMVQCVLKCLHNRTKLTDDVYSFLERVLTCRGEVINLLPRVQNMCETVKEASRRLVTYQLQRQKDMWQLISASIRQSKQLQDKLTKQQKITTVLQQQVQNLNNSLDTSDNIRDNGLNISARSSGLQTTGSDQPGSTNFRLNLGSMSSNGSVGRSLQTPSSVLLDKNTEMCLSSMQSNSKLRKELSALQQLSLTAPAEDLGVDWEFLHKNSYTC